MNWDAIAAIAELVAAAGVIASLIYVALQVRHNTGAQRLTAQQSAIASLRDTYRLVLRDDNLRVFRIGVEDLEELDEDERARLLILVMDMLRAFESVYFTHLEGTLGPGVWEGWQRVLADYSAAPGVRHFWGLRKDIFSRPFRDLVDSLDERDEAIRVAGLTEPARPSLAATRPEGF